MVLCFLALIQRSPAFFTSVLVVSVLFFESYLNFDSLVQIPVI